MNVAQLIKALKSQEAAGRGEWEVVIPDTREGYWDNVQNVEALEAEGIKWYGPRDMTRIVSIITLETGNEKWP